MERENLPNGISLSSVFGHAHCVQEKMAQGENVCRILGRCQWLCYLVRDLRKELEDMTQEGQEQRHMDGNMGVGAKCGNFGITH